MTFVFLFLVELALLFLCLVVFNSSGFHCFLQTSLHFQPRWFPFSFFINHLIIMSYRFPFKAQSHSNFLHHLHRFHKDCILLLDCLSSPCSFNQPTSRLGHVAGDTQSCLLYVSLSDFSPLSPFCLIRYNRSSLARFPNNVLSSEFSLNCLIRFLQLTDTEAADVHCIGSNRYNLHVYCLAEIGIIEFGVYYHFHPL